MTIPRGHRQRVGDSAGTGGGTRRRRQVRWVWLWLPAVLFIVVVYVAPMLLLLSRSVTEDSAGFENYSRILTSSGYLSTIVRTLVLAGASALLALVIGYPVAYLIATGKPWLRNLLIFAVITPYLTSTLIKTYAWQVLLGRLGPVNWLLQTLGLGEHSLIFNSFAVLVSLTHYALPLTIFPLVSVMRQVDLTQLRAARSLGAGPAVAFARVFVPQTRPGILVALVLTFVYGVGAFVYPALLGGQSGSMIGVLIQTAINTNADYGLAAAASVLLGVSVAIVFGLVAFVKKRRISSVVSPALRELDDRDRGPSTGKGLVVPILAVIAGVLDRTRLSRHGWLVTGYGLVVAALILLPQLLAIPASFSSERTLAVPPPGWSLRWYENFFSAEWLEPLWVSVEIAVMVCVAATVLGTLAAVGVSRGLGNRARGSVTGLMLLPLLFPTVVAAAAFYLIFVQFGLVDNVFGIALAHLTLALPFVYTLVFAGLMSVDPGYERAATSLGAGRLTVLRRITVPLVSGTIITGALFALLNSFDESTISIFLSGVRVTTLPKAMYDGLSIEVDPTVGVVAVLFIVVIGAGAIGSGLYRRAKARRNRPIEPSQQTDVVKTMGTHV